MVFYWAAFVTLYAGIKTRRLEQSSTAVNESRRDFDALLARAETIITLQKKVAEILGIPLKPLDIDETD